MTFAHKNKKSNTSPETGKNHQRYRIYIRPCTFKSPTYIACGFFLVDFTTKPPPSTRRTDSTSGENSNFPVSSPAPLTPFSFMSAIMTCPGFSPKLIRSPLTLRPGRSTFTQDLPAGTLIDTEDLFENLSFDSCLYNNRITSDLSVEMTAENSTPCGIH